MLSFATVQGCASYSVCKLSILCKDYTQTHLPCNLMSVQVAICIYLSYAFAVIEEMNASSFSVAMYGHPNLRDCNRNV